jgi:hypothetical protein
MAIQPSTTTAQTQSPIRRQPTPPTAQTIPTSSTAPPNPHLRHPPSPDSDSARSDTRLGPSPRWPEAKNTSTVRSLRTVGLSHGLETPEPKLWVAGSTGHAGMGC